MVKYKVIVADDEPLTLIGLESLIEWEDEGFSIVEKAHNGEELSLLIEKIHPDLVITDIKMPLKSGLEVIEETLTLKKEKAPIFVLLTSYEEFDLAKKAIQFNVVEYLVKLELTPDNLKATLEKARKILSEKNANNTTFISQKDHVGNELLVEKFFIRQFFHLGYNETPIKTQAKNLGLDIDYPYFVVAFASITNDAEERENNPSISYSSMKLVGETSSRYLSSHTTGLDMYHFAIIFMLKEEEKVGYKNLIYSALKKSIENNKDLLSVDLQIGVGELVDDFSYLSESFLSAKMQSSLANNINPISFFSKELGSVYYNDQVDLSKYIKRLKKAIEEVDLLGIEEALKKMAGELRNQKISRLSAIDVSSNVLYMIITSINGGEDILKETFPSSTVSHGYRVIYQAGNGGDCADFLDKLSLGLIKALKEKKKDYRALTIEKIENYINENITRTLTLSEVSSLFGYSQGYLSSIFPKYTGMSFVDYVATLKIQKAKEMLGYSDVMVYEVAQKLGFESPFYFSKVFKKIAGVSPSDYVKKTRRIYNEG